MVILGLTGSIGMGKSTAATMLRRLGLPIHDSDAIVHRLLGPGGEAVPVIARAVPEVVRGDTVDRRTLGARAFADPAIIGWLESILHPLVRRERDRFLAAMARQRRRVVVLDIPLLLETGGERCCDRVVTVTAPGFIQRQRVLARPGMTAAKLEQILARQLPDRDKRRRADWVVVSSLGRAQTFRALRRVVRAARAIRGGHWPPLPTRRSARRQGERQEAWHARSGPGHRDHRA